MMNDEYDRPVGILLVDDNLSDVRLTQEAFKEGDMPINLHVALDGFEALAFLRKEGRYAGVPRPDIILLDLNMPRMNGVQVLKEIKADENLRRIPVIILTTSKAEEDILKTYDLHANCFITKSVDMEHFIKVMKYVEDFWFTVVKLPGE
ncbi:MAG: response regulator [Halobacteriota archaeon]|nr:response regulator [Halobacteriota archaeon]